jgi:hypothetical protein
MQSTLIIAGAAFLGAAIVGGGLVAFKIEVPLIESPIRQALLGVLGLTLLVGGFLSGSDEGATNGAVAPASDMQVTDTTGSPTSTVGEGADSTSSNPTTSDAVSSLPPSPTGTVLVMDGDGELGIVVPDDWLTAVEADSIWASPGVADWILATNGGGPADAVAYYIRRAESPSTGTSQEIAAGFLNEMPVPARCIFNSSAVTDMPGWYYSEYRWYDCEPGGQLLQSATLDLWPPWVVLQSARYLDATDRVTVERIGESVVAR